MKKKSIWVRQDLHLDAIAYFKIRGTKADFCERWEVSRTTLNKFLNTGICSEEFAQVVNVSVPKGCRNINK